MIELLFDDRPSRRLLRTGLASATLYLFVGVLWATGHATASNGVPDPPPASWAGDVAAWPAQVVADVADG